MKTSQQAEREEQQRIKNLVLNYDLQQSDDQDSKYIAVLNYSTMVNADEKLGGEKQPTFYHNRVERTGKDRGQRVRKLQLSDVDW